MKLLRPSLRAALAIFAATAFGTVLAADPIPITADQAFDAVTMHIDPETGDPANVVLIDVRDPVEYFFNGAAAEVTKIYLKGNRGKGRAVAPDWGKVRLLHDGKFIEYWVDGRYQRTQVAQISDLGMEALAYNIPLWWYDVADGWGDLDERQDEQEAFVEAMADFAANFPEEGSPDPDAPHKVILYCRTGGRSSIAGGLIAGSLFDAADVYEIDDPAHQNGRGGFSGPAWSTSSTAYNGYNGYAGFPGRETPPDPREDVHASVSWLDSGLPVITTVKPLP